MFSFIINFFKALFDLIPKLMYMLYASLVCLLDVLQLFFRKLAGLDLVYITDPVTGKVHRTTGDLVTQFITGILGINEYGLEYSILSTVFWSFIIFGVIILFASTLIAIIKSHYNYDEKAAKGPMQYVYTAGRALVAMAIVPITIVLGLYLSQAVLTALDSFTSTSDTAIISLYGSQPVANNLVAANVARAFDERNTDASGKLDESKMEKSYVYYDVFGASSGCIYGNVGYSSLEMQIREEFPSMTNIAATNATFSGSLFKAAAYNASRIRKYNWYGQDGDRNRFVGDEGYEYMGCKFDLFREADGNEELAEMVDTAFACNLHTSKPIMIRYDNGTWQAWISPTFFTQFLAIGTNAFSKFNVGFVWYYYDLWQFNFIVGFGAVIVCFSIFLNIILGLMARFFMCIVLFLISPPLYGLMPLDNGQAAKNWRENFMKQVLMAYGAVVGMNLVLLILPYVNQIKFFNIGIADALASTLFIIVGLITIKAVIATVSAIIGAADANKTGEDMKQEVGGAIGGALKMTAGAAKFSGKIAGAYNKGLGKVGEKLGGKIFAGGQNMMTKGGNKFTRGVAKTFGGITAGLGSVVGVASNLPKLAQKGMAKAGEGIGKLASHISGNAHKKELEEHKQVQKLIDSLDGQAGDTFKGDEFEVEARKYMSDARAHSLRTEMEAYATSMGTNPMKASDAHTRFESADSTYRLNNVTRGFSDKAILDREIKRADAKVQARAKWGETLMSPFKMVNENVIGADKGAAAVRDAVKKPVDQQRRAADYAETNLELTKKMLAKLDEIAKKP